MSSSVSWLLWEPRRQEELRQEAIQLGARRGERLSSGLTHLVSVVLIYF